MHRFAIISHCLRCLRYLTPIWPTGSRSGLAQQILLSVGSDFLKSSIQRFELNLYKIVKFVFMQFSCKAYWCAAFLYDLIRYNFHLHCCCVESFVSVSYWSALAVNGRMNNVMLQSCKRKLKSDWIIFDITT